MALSEERRDRLCDRAQALEREKRMPGLSPEHVKVIEAEIAKIDRILDAS